jgi:hypothetical protein
MPSRRGAAGGDVFAGPTSLKNATPLAAHAVPAPRSSRNVRRLTDVVMDERVRARRWYAHSSGGTLTSTLLPKGSGLLAATEHLVQQSSATRSEYDVAAFRTLVAVGFLSVGVVFASFEHALRLGAGIVITIALVASLLVVVLRKARGSVTGSARSRDRGGCG